MKAPPWLLGAAVLFWGSQTEAWLVAVPAALALAAAQFVPLRWDFSAAQLNRVADFCTVLAVAVTGYLFISYGSPRGVILVFQWLPPMLLPLALARLYGTATEWDLSVLFWNLRRNPPRRLVRFDPLFSYYAIWLLAASAANVRSELFYLAIAALTALPLALARPRSFALARWAGAFGLALAIGYGVQHGLHETQLWLEGAVPEWMVGSGARTNPYRSMTDIGHIGELKQSDAIVLRVTSESGAKPPRLLHRASYNTYAAASWIAQGGAFADVAPAAGGENWALFPEARAVARVRVDDFSAQMNPLLSLPENTVTVERLTARRVTRNPLGAVQTERDPGYFSYVAALAPDRSFDAPPSPSDQRVSRTEHEHFAQLAAELRLAGLPAAAVIERVQQHFLDNFQYATFQARASGAASPIVDFMRRTRAGHCEYFATATVLLLRAAGVPARYATGFAVHEFSALEGAYLVRQRHAHAWARAWVEGAWIDVDTTPPQWVAIEAGAAPMWSALADVWSWLRFRAARAWAQSGARIVVAALLAGLPFLLWLAWRLYRSRKRTTKPVTEAPASESVRPGADSELYLIAERLAALGWGRRPHETFVEWAERLNADAPFDARALLGIVELHNRYRFDPAGIDHRERGALREAATAWLADAMPRTPT